MKSKIARKFEVASERIEAANMAMMTACYEARIGSKYRSLTRDVFHPELILYNFSDKAQQRMRATALAFAAAMVRTGDL